MIVDNHLRLRRSEERDDRGEDYAEQHQTLLVDSRLVLEQDFWHRLRLRSMGVLCQEEKHHCDDTAIAVL